LLSVIITDLEKLRLVGKQSLVEENSFVVLTNTVSLITSDAENTELLSNVLLLVSIDERLIDRLLLNRDDTDKDLLLLKDLDFDNTFVSLSPSVAASISEYWNNDVSSSTEEPENLPLVAVNLSVLVAENVGVDRKTELLLMRPDELIGLVLVSRLVSLKLRLLLNSPELDISDDEKRGERSHLNVFSNRLD
jgi:hypothetical protein